MSNFGLRKFIKDLGGNFVRTKVGDRYIVERMLNGGATFWWRAKWTCYFKEFCDNRRWYFSCTKVIECVKILDKPA